VSDYKRLDELGIPVHLGPMSYVKPDEIQVALEKHGMSMKEFDRLFGVQTAPIVDGKMALYPWDCNAVLERLISGRRTGSQLIWDMIAWIIAPITALVVMT